MLILPIKKKWFDMILSGEKKEEYREIKARCRLRIGKGRPQWGASPDKQYYILEILDKEKLAADEKRVGDE